jgi:multidrug efflux pump subunit AcrA (membrane-fusion protein)
MPTHSRQQTRSGRALLRTLVCLLSGLSLLLSARPLAAALGMLMVIGAFLSLLARANRLWKEGRSRRAEEIAETRRQAKRSRRRERDAQERARLRLRREQERQARIRQEKREARQKEEAQAEAARQAAERLAAEAAGEAARQELLLLDEPTLTERIAQIFARRGFRVEAVRPGEWRLESVREGTLHVARCLPRHPQATLSDLRDIEAWRRDEGAHYAYLIALEGFAPEAAQQARHYPVTLIESYLLASWQQAAESSER